MSCRQMFTQRQGKEGVVMPNKKTFFRKFLYHEEAVDFAEKVKGRIQKDGCTVEFEATYSISKALYNVKSDRYRVYIRLRTEEGNPLTFISVSQYAREATQKAKERVKGGWL